MRQSRLHHGRQVAKALGGYEAAVDRSILDSLALIGSIITYRLETGAAAEVGHEALMSAKESLVALSEARDRAVTCHRQLTVTRDAERLDANDVGCTWNKGDNSRFKVVAAAA